MKKFIRYSAVTLAALIITTLAYGGYEYANRNYHPHIDDVQMTILTPADNTTDLGRTVRDALYCDGITGCAEGPGHQLYITHLTRLSEAEVIQRIHHLNGIKWTVKKTAMAETPAVCPMDKLGNWFDF